MYYQKIDTIIGMRLHSCLLALMCGVPAISISYLPKCSDIMNDLGLSDFVIDVKDVDVEGLIEMVYDLRNESVRREYWERFEGARDDLSHDFNRLFEGHVSDFFEQKSS